MKGRRKKTVLCCFFVLFSLSRGRCDRQEWEGHRNRDGDSENEAAGTYHLVELYSTMLSSETLTVRPVAVFHSHEALHVALLDQRVPFHRSEPC